MPCNCAKRREKLKQLLKRIIPTRKGRGTKKSQAMAAQTGAAVANSKKANLARGSEQ